MKMSFSPLQLLSPVQLVFCFVLFFLPWIELSCTLPAEATKGGQKAEMEAMKKETGVDPTKPISMYTQSGLQIATGDVSVASDFEKISAQMKKGVGGGAGLEPDPKAKKKDGETAPLLFLFPVALLAGIGVGCAPFQHLLRRLALAVVCLGALGVVGLQAAIGFPLEKEIAKQKEQLKGFGGVGGGFGPAPDPKGGKVKAAAPAAEPEIFRVTWKIPLYLTFLLLLGATATAFVDGGLLAGSKKPKRRYGSRDDDEEDEDDRPRKKKRAVAEDLSDEDEDDRPRKKKKRVEEDDEDEPPVKKAKKPAPVEDLPEDEPVPPPRKKAAAPPPPPPAASGNPFDFGSDDEPPRKKRRDEDDEDDDRPRKKKRRDD